MTRNLLPLVVLGALAAVAATASAEYYEGKPECPPDMACTMTEDAGAPPPGEDRSVGDCVDWCPRDGADGGSGAGAPTGGDAPPGGVDVDRDQVTCMDGSAPPEVCESDVRHLDGQDQGRDQGQDQGQGLEASGDARRPVPAIGLALFAAALAVAGVAAVRRR